MGLQGDVIEMVVLDPAAAFDLQQSPPVGAASEHIDAQTDIVMRESRLEDCRNGWVLHQRGRARDGIGMLPRGLLDPHAAGEQQLRLAADLQTDIDRGAGRRLLVALRLMDLEPQATEALEAGQVAGLGEVRRGHDGPSEQIPEEWDPSAACATEQSGPGARPRPVLSSRTGGAFLPRGRMTNANQEAMSRSMR
ncbi:hypothetical protein [Acidiphilium sp.]|uniref:hypothetical protein n=1 Tax=Acidiphilium sp. TaxID=527 RepID=UPI00258F70FD|nr:hypothetical protein [Acidiphilium sp.]